MEKPTWHTYPMSARAADGVRGFKHANFLSHAVDTATWKCLCRVSADSLCPDTSFYAPGELPDCPRCCAKIKKLSLV
jgi:hypothetical protein